MPPHHRHPRRDARLSAFLDHDRIDRLLAPFVPDSGDRAFVVRCLLDEGPAHHRGSNWVLLALLAELAGPSPAPAASGASEAVPMRLPPHLAEEREDADYAISIPRAPIERLAPNDPQAQRAMIDCLTDGPPQHALANAAMVCLLDALLRQRNP